MSRRYDPAFKTEILRQLDANGGNVALTVLQTGVPRRTLFRWKTQRDLVPQMPPLPVLPQVPSLIDEKEGEAVEDLQETLSDLQRDLLKQIRHLIKTMRPSIDSAPLNQRVVAFSMLVDRFLMLQHHLAQSSPSEEQIIRFEFMDPDGSIHDTPQWSRDE